MSWLAKYSAGLSLSVLIILVVCYGVFEAIHIADSSNREMVTEQEIYESLDNRVDFFENLSAEFKKKSDQVYTDISEAIQSDVNRMALYNRLNNYDVWGITVLRGDEKWIWKGFDLSTPSDATTIDGELEKISIANFNNVVVYLSQHSFDFNDDHYTVLTADKLYQVSDLAFTESITSQFTDQHDLQDNSQF